MRVDTVKEDLQVVAAGAGCTDTPGEPVVVCKADTLEHLEHDSLWIVSSRNSEQPPDNICLNVNSLIVTD